MIPTLLSLVVYPGELGRRPESAKTALVTVSAGHHIWTCRVGLYSIRFVSYTAYGT